MSSPSSVLTSDDPSTHQGRSSVAAPIPYKPKKSLPALKVKPDPSLKSCLSPSIDPTRRFSEETIALAKEHLRLSEDTPSRSSGGHPLFVQPNDNVSPINHGLTGDDPNSIKSPLAGFDTKLTPATSPPQYMETSKNKKHMGKTIGSEKVAANLSSSGQNDLQSQQTYTRENKTLDVLNSPQYQNSNKDPERKLHLLIGITGCISISKNVFLIIEKLFDLYTSEKLEIQVVLTRAAEWFLTDKLYKFENMGVKVWFSDDGEAFYTESKVEMQMTGVAKPAIQMYLAPELQRWTDVLLLAPLSANTLAKLINGLSDDLLTDILHNWPTTHYQKHSGISNADNTIITNNMEAPKPIVAALALTSSMYAHPITKLQISLLQETYPDVSILKPVEKCVDVDGNISMGGMRSWREVVDFVSKKLGEPEQDDEDDDTQNDDDDITDSSLPEIHLAKETQISPPIIDIEKKPGASRSRSNTLTRKELQEHEELALKNAILNTGGAR